MAALHVLRGRVGHLPEHLFGGRVDVLEPLARRGFDQFAIDEHADFTATNLARHASTPFGSAETPFSEATDPHGTGQDGDSGSAGPRSVPEVSPQNFQGVSNSR